MEFLIEYSVFIVAPVAAAHIALDIFDKHRHGIRIHDWIGGLSAVLLVAHVGLDILGLVA